MKINLLHMKTKSSVALISIIMLMCGCTQNNIEYYDQEPRIDFNGFSNIGDQEMAMMTEFNDADYLNKVTEKIDSVAVIVLGRLLTSPMTFCMKTEPDTTAQYAPEIVFAREYIQPAGVYISWPKYLVKRPKLYDKSHEVYLVFDLNNAAHQFLPGRVEAAKMGCIVEFKLEPMEGWNKKLWNPEFLGVYSNGKYKFIMDTYEKIYKDLTVNAAFKLEVRAKYAEYKAAGGEPIMDDQNVPEEIIFPE